MATPPQGAKHAAMRGKGVVEYRLLRDEQIMLIEWIQAPPGEGGELLAYAESLARRWHATKVQLWTHVEPGEDEDTVLRRFNFFQRHGYRFVGLERVDMPAGGSIVRFKREKVLVKDDGCAD